jgi:HEAT repeat protein
MESGGQAEYLTRIEVHNLIVSGEIELIVGMGSEAVPVLGNILVRGEFWAQKIAIAALGRIDAPAAVRILRRALENPEMGIRIEAAQALEKRKGRSIDQLLRQLAERDVSWDVRKVAKEVIERRGKLVPAKSGNVRAKPKPNGIAPQERRRELQKVS